jgi:SEC-C motif-containing protein
MRSRYSAFALSLPGYLLRTWHPSTRPRRLDLEDTVWRRLQIVDRAAGGQDDDTGVVEFRATYLATGGLTVLHERSRFVRESGAWFYLDGDQLP